MFLNVYPQKSPLDKGKIRTQDQSVAFYYAGFEQIKRRFFTYSKINYI